MPDGVLDLFCGSLALGGMTSLRIYFKSAINHMQPYGAPPDFLTEEGAALLSALQDAVRRTVRACAPLDGSIDVSISCI